MLCFQLSITVCHYESKSKVVPVASSSPHTLKPLLALLSPTFIFTKTLLCECLQENGIS